MGKMYIYYSDKKFIPDNNTVIEVTDVLTFSQSEQQVNNRTVGIKVVKKKYYQNLLTEFKLMGFKRVNTYINEDNNITTTYRSSKYPKVLLSEIIGKESGGDYKWNSYFVGVETTK